jgi:hypothetical protein
MQPLLIASPRSTEEGAHGLDWDMMAPMKEERTRTAGVNARVTTKPTDGAAISKVATKIAIDAAVAITGDVLDKRLRINRSRPMPMARMIKNARSFPALRLMDVLRV